MNGQYEQLAEKGIIQEYADIFTLNEDAILQLEGFKEKSVQNLVQAIKARKRVPLARLLFGLSIDGVGEEVAVKLTEYFGSVDAMLDAGTETIQKVSGVGEVLAEGDCCLGKRQNKEKHAACFTETHHSYCAEKEKKKIIRCPVSEL